MGKKKLRKKKFGSKKILGQKFFCVKKNCTFCPLALSAVGPFVCFYNVLDLSSFGPSVFCTKRLLYQASFVPSALWTIRLLYHVPCTKCLWTKCLWTNCPGTVKKQHVFVGWLPLGGFMWWQVRRSEQPPGDEDLG